MSMMKASLVCRSVFLFATCFVFVHTVDPPPKELMEKMDPETGSKPEAATSDVAQNPVLECGAYVRFPNGSDTPFTIDSYLSSKKVFPCFEDINRNLKDIFNKTNPSVEIRKQLRSNLGNTCSVFIDVISKIVFTNLSHDICVEQSLGDAVIVRRNFCRTEDASFAEAITIHTNLISMKFSAVANEFMKLLSLKNCSRQCGSGNGSVFCNAFYSMAKLLSQKFPAILAGRKVGGLL